MKGYYTQNAYYGYLPSIGKYLQFATETEYITYYKETE